MSKRFSKLLAAGVLGLVVSACGGGGGDAAPPPAPPEPSPVLPQGLWDTADKSMAVYVLPLSSGEGEVWAIERTTPYLIQGQLQVAGAGFAADTARYLKSSASGSADAQALVQASGDGQLSIGAKAVGLPDISVTGLTASATYNRSAALSDWAGTWDIAGDELVSHVSVAADGTITGNRGACNLSGAVSLRAEAKAVVNVSIQESECAEASNYAGIGVFARDADGLVIEDRRSFVLKNANATRFTSIPLVKAAADK